MEQAQTAPRNEPITKMDRYGDRYIRRNRKWAKISKQPNGGYLLACGWEGQLHATIGGVRRNIKLLGTAKDWAADWLDD